MPAALVAVDDTIAAPETRLQDVFCRELQVAELDYRDALRAAPDLGLGRGTPSDLLAAFPWRRQHPAIDCSLCRRFGRAIWARQPARGACYPRGCRSGRPSARFPAGLGAAVDPQWMTLAR